MGQKEGGVLPSEAFLRETVARVLVWEKKGDLLP